ncbi:MAG: chorismate mutase [Spirochaetes bacterium]|nr:MAG: chorismate mutase [Spirochaetota bacterium]
MTRTRAVRGAVQINRDSEELIDTYVGELVGKIVTLNKINEEDIISIQFTVTGDLRSKNPAASLRKYGFKNVPLFCSLEPDIEGAMERVIRVLVTVERTDGNPLIPVYMNGAERLRPDLAG